MLVLLPEPPFRVVVVVGGTGGVRRMLGVNSRVKHNVIPELKKAAVHKLCIC